MNSDYSISVRSITKVFAGVKALDNVSIDVVSGKVHGLIGANGAGKSTLIKILAGVYHPDEGQILIDGNEVKITDPATSTALGLSFIHQDLHLVEHFNVMQNMLMGEKKDTKLGLIDWKKSTQKIQKVLELVNFTKPLTTKAKDLSTGDQWLIAIAKALMHDAKFIAMDEPTAALSEAEVENLFRIVRDLTSHGIGVIYVSHRLDEILELCDEITVFKDGKKILYELTSNISKEELITAIAGHKIKHLDSITYRFSDAETVLQVEHLHDKKLNVVSIIATIGSGSLVYGLNYMYSHGSPVLTGIPTEFNQLTLTRIGGKLPVNILYMATVSLILWIMLNRTELGERIKAVGGNIVSAKLAGIRSDRIKIIAYIICAMCCAVTGILLASVMGAGTSSACDAYMVNSFAAVYVGSATLKDGEFHIVGTLIGVLITTIAFNGLAILGIDTYAQYLFQGFIILFSVALSSVARKYAIK